MKFCHVFILLILLPCMTLAVQPDEMLADVKLEQRARDIGAELRCLVCQNQSIDDSDADLAHDLRILVRQRLLAGDSNMQVKEYIVSRYGDYVLLKPPFRLATFMLWFGPGLLLITAIFFVVAYYSKRNKNLTLSEETQPLSKDEKSRLGALFYSEER